GSGTPGPRAAPPRSGARSRLPRPGPSLGKGLLAEHDVVGIELDDPDLDRVVVGVEGRVHHLGDPLEQRSLLLRRAPRAHRHLHERHPDLLAAQPAVTPRSLERIAPWTPTASSDATNANSAAISSGSPMPRNPVYRAMSSK